ncbi:MAG: sulfatase-like hydrolase/transferase, partial [Phycisphaeraceae bacterium]|nr:sulfatase-like hydrolase/transferase [Phycisphaeraceae bacterium]
MPTPPNVLILLTDEQRADTLACGGGDADLMPGLNRWAERATCFTQAYCTQPVCTPSRASIFT